MSLNVQEEEEEMAILFYLPHTISVRLCRGGGGGWQRLLWCIFASHPVVMSFVLPLVMFMVRQGVCSATAQRYCKKGWQLISFYRRHHDKDIEWEHYCLCKHFFIIIFCSVEVDQLLKLKLCTYVYEARKKVKYALGVTGMQK